MFFAPARCQRFAHDARRISITVSAAIIALGFSAVRAESTVKHDDHAADVAPSTVPSAPSSEKTTPSSPFKPNTSAAKKGTGIEPEPLAAEPSTTLLQGDQKEAAPVDLPPFPNPMLACGAVPPKMPHIVIILKTKNGEKQTRHRLACLKLAMDRDDLPDSSRQDLDTVADYVVQLNNVVRLYLDLITFVKEDNELETRFRRQAFAVKKHLTEKGVFAHLEKNREGHFPTSFAEAADKKAKAEATAKAAADAAARARIPKATRPAAPKRRDTGKEYTYYVNRPSTVYPNDDPSQYSPTKHSYFEFVPLDSVYFPHDVDALNDRARVTLDSVARYISDHPETDRVLIIGHADYTGTEKYNYLLTDRRALNVRDYLLTQGISNRLLEVASAGENDAVDENWTRSGQARNRRVQLFVIHKRDLSPAPLPSASSTPPRETEPAPAPFLYPGAIDPDRS